MTWRTGWRIAVTAYLLEHVRADIQRGKYEQPDNIDEMPVHSADSQHRMAPFIEKTERGPHQQHRKHDNSHHHVQHVKARDCEIKRAVQMRYRAVWMVMPLL